MRPALLSRTLRGWLGAFSCAAILVFAGCSGKEGGSPSANDVITGKVTMNGQIVAGQLVFIGSDKKEIMSMIGPMDGSYQINNPPKGEGVFIIKGSTGPSLAPPPGGAKMPEMPSTGGVAPPAKYEKAATSDLKFNVTGGKQTYDINLNP
jgi:hypothetical protein